MKFSLRGPFVKKGRPRLKRLSPARIARHVIAETNWITAGQQCVLRKRGKLSEVLASARLVFGVSVDECIVRIGLKGLLATAFTAQHDPAIRNWRRSEIGFGELENLDDKTIIHLGNHAGDVTCLRAFPQQKRQKAADALIRLRQILHVGLRLGESHYVERRLALQHHRS